MDFLLGISVLLFLETGCRDWRIKKKTTVTKNHPLP